VRLKMPRNERSNQISSVLVGHVGLYGEPKYHLSHDEMDTSYP